MATDAGNTTRRKGSLDLLTTETGDIPEYLINGVPVITGASVFTSLFVNNNSTATIIGSNGVLQDIVFGGSGLVITPSTQGFTLIDEITGIIEYTSSASIVAKIGYDYIVSSVTGFTEFEFNWQLDTGGGFANLSEDVRSSIEVGINSESVSKGIQAVNLSQGDQLKPQILRVSGTSDIIFKNVSISVSNQR